MKLRPLAMGLALGITWGAGVMIATWWLMMMGTQGKTMALLQNFYLGYSVSFVGGLVGLAWGFVDGFIGGLLFALLYNFFARGKSKTAES